MVLSTWVFRGGWHGAALGASRALRSARHPGDLLPRSSPVKSAEFGGLLGVYRCLLFEGEVVRFHCLALMSC